MKFKNYLIFAALTLAFSMIAASGALAQGNSGRGGGRPANPGPPAGVPGRPDGMPGVDRGLDTASERSNGRSDAGLGNASTRSNGRSDAGLDRARMAQQNAAPVSDHDLNRYRGLSNKLGTTPEQMRSAYLAALQANPDLSYGNWVAANVLADNLSGRYPSVTSSAILAGLANGDSIGHTLRELGLGKDEAKQAERDAKERIKAAKRQNH